MAAVVTLLQMAAENSSPAELDRSHDTALRHRHRSAVLLTIICTVAAEYIRYFQPRPIGTPKMARPGLTRIPHLFFQRVCHRFCIVSISSHKFDNSIRASGFDKGTVSGKFLRNK
jgi:hypothetical protein